MKDYFLPVEAVLAEEEVFLHKEYWYLFLQTGMLPEQLMGKNDADNLHNVMTTNIVPSKMNGYLTKMTTLFQRGQGLLCIFKSIPFTNNGMQLIE